MIGLNGLKGSDDKAQVWGHGDQADFFKLSAGADKSSEGGKNLQQWQI
jgi:hypothetical protein